MKKDLNYNEDITSRNNEELEKLTREDDDAQDLKFDELTSLESHDTTKDEVLKTISEMVQWVDMHEKFLSYNEDITSRNNEELEKLTRGDDDAQDLKALVVMEDELTSLESHDMTKDEVLNTISEMAPWGDMHEELKVEGVTPMSKVEEYII